MLKTIAIIAAVLVAPAAEAKDSDKIFMTPATLGEQLAPVTAEGLAQMFVFNNVCHKYVELKNKDIYGMFTLMEMDYEAFLEGMSSEAFQSWTVGKTSVRASATINEISQSNDLKRAVAKEIYCAISADSFGYVYKNEGNS